MEEKMSRAENKATRLLQIENLLLAHPEGLTQSQIADRVQVDRSTITRYIPDFPKHFYYDEDDGRRWKIDRTADLINVCFNLHEATAVHLASRLLATRMDKQNPHAASTLRKLGFALERIAPHISDHLCQSADVMDTAAQRHDPNFLRTLEQLTLAWAEGRKVKIWHRHSISDKTYSYTFSPYFIEPYAVGQSVHVIGFREPPESIRTFKIERIERIEALNERYTIPSDFDPRDLLKDAWGIWYTEAEPVRVVLKFHASIAQRIKETRWHVSEQVSGQPDGSLLWEARIAEPKEMLPWIRGFGADVEVLEPEKMRAALEREVKIMAEVYGVMEKRKNLFAHFRGEDKEHKEPQYLMEHLTAVSELAGKFADKIGLKETGEILGLLHDAGKASQEFQNYLLSGEGLKDPDADDFVNYREKKGKIDHSTAGAQLIYEALWNKDQKEKIAAQVLSLC
ncbi:MAG: CRISPR-associated endonuclease Cas3'', partial [Anaerolineaceae bacterium]|nr:CRISPR-associated endonuclease Cas3'' [Anaerolineaceae bacterium]